MHKIFKNDPLPFFAQTIMDDIDAAFAALSDDDLDAAFDSINVVPFAELDPIVPSEVAVGPFAIAIDIKSDDDVEAACFSIGSIGNHAKAKPVPRPTNLDNVANSWKRMNTLNAGDQLDRLFLDPNLRPSDLPHQHKNAWDHTGFVREGWCQVGSGGRRRGDLSHTNRELDVLCCLSRIWQLLQEHAQYLNPALNGRLGSIYLSIYHDATPLFVRFGALAVYCNHMHDIY